MARKMTGSIFAGPSLPGMRAPQRSEAELKVGEAKARPRLRARAMSTSPRGFGAKALTGKTRRWTGA